MPNLLLPPQKIYTTLLTLSTTMGKKSIYLFLCEAEKFTEISRFFNVIAIYIVKITAETLLGYSQDSCEYCNLDILCI